MTDSIHQFSPEQYTGSIMTSVDLPSGSELQSPTEELVSWLQKQDSRVHYFPADRARAEHAFRGHEFGYSVIDVIGQQVSDDFAGQKIMVRGTTAALAESFPFWQDEDSVVGQMNTVLDILNVGSDTGRTDTRVGYIDPPEGGRPAVLNAQTKEWLGQHMASVDMSLRNRDDPAAKKQLEQTFPVLLVYDESSFEDSAGHGWRVLGGESSERIKAIYITDKVQQHPERPDQSEAAKAARAEQVGQVAISIHDLL